MNGILDSKKCPIHRRGSNTSQGKGKAHWKMQGKGGTDKEKEAHIHTVKGRRLELEQSGVTEKEGVKECTSPRGGKVARTRPRGKGRAIKGDTPF